MNDDILGILFICTHNACRSIVAEVVTRDLAGSRLRVASAGSHPAGKIHPLTLDYLHARGYSTEGRSSKSLDETSHFKPDIVITVCDSAAGEGCPAWLDSAEKVHWGLIDPTAIEGTKEARQKAFDEVVRISESRMQSLLNQRFERLNVQQQASLLSYSS